MMWRVFYVLFVAVVGHGQSLGDPSTNAIREASGHANNDNSNLNLLRRRDNEVRNISAMIALIDRNCQQYCSEQIQYNSVCVRRGCSKWKVGLREGCASLCSAKDNSFRETYACKFGCSRAIEEYYFKITAFLGAHDAPTLISGSLKSSSLELSWDGPKRLPYLSYSVQRRRIGSPWETIPTQHTMNSTRLSVINLKPFTQYQFRVGWILAHDFPPSYSRESNPIETLPNGIPNAPEITSIQPISNTSVAVTWLPPTQPNGRLIAYILKIQKVPNGHVIIKEIPFSENPRGYTFSSLEPVTNYSLAISALNSDGEGDATSIHFVTPQTTMSNEVSNSPEPKLVVQGIHDVYFQNMDLLMGRAVSIFTSSNNISSIAVHVQQKWLFIATSDGEIRRSDLYRNYSVTIVEKERLEMSVAFLSVDWLHNKLYMVGKKPRSSNWLIKRCDLGGNSLDTVYSYLYVKPIDFAADPFTGYLYWVIPAVSFAVQGGLYKLDLVADRMNNSPIPQTVLDGPDLGPFTIDVMNYRILVIHKSRNTVLSVSLDGDILDIRGNTQSPQFNKAKSIARYKGLLYWTTPDSVFMEEYNSLENSYYQSGFGVASLHQPLGKLLVVHPDLQPVPVPMAAPKNLQGLFGQNRARLSWRRPPSISALGEGAWREWLYEVRVSDNRTFSNISATEFILQDLRPSTFYTVQVLAYSANGRGPISLPTRGKTLKRTSYNITLLWASQSGLYSTNMLGEDVKLLTSSPQSSWKAPSAISVPSTPFNEDFVDANMYKLYMSSMTWFESTVFFSLNNGSVFHHTSHEDASLASTKTNQATNSNEYSAFSEIKGIGFAQSLAFDYIGSRLYWSNPKVLTIYRCLITEPNGWSCWSKQKLPLVTMAREIAVDSYRGLLLWTTGHSIEMSRLNGYSHGTLFQNGLYSGKQITGMTLDTDQSKIYWITRSASGCSVQRRSYTIRGAQFPMVIANYEDTPVTGPIRYFNDRLLWLQGSSEAVITDLYGQGKSSLKINTINNITNVHVKDQGSLKYPGGLPKNRVQVNPDSVVKWTIDIKGKWNNFTVSWHPVNNTNYGKIFYEVVLNNSVSNITAFTNVTIENGSLFEPYSEIEVSITALTYWASAKPTIARLKTPQWIPSEPINPRVYISNLSYPYVPSLVMKNFTIPKRLPIVKAEFRWDKPVNPNGLILGYKVDCWKNSRKSNDCNCTADVDKQSCEMVTLSLNSRYHFTVKAYSTYGLGKTSKKILVDTSYSNPVPKLLITTSDKLEILDIDRNKLETIELGHLSPISAGFLAAESTIFWINQGQDIMKATVNHPSYNKSRLLSLLPKSDAGSLCVDWIGRKLYWASDLRPSQGDYMYGIVMHDLTTLDTPGQQFTPNNVQVIVSSKTPIRSVAFNPFLNALYWTTSKRNGHTTIYTADGRDNFTARPFINRDFDSACNCTSLSSFGDPIAFDPTGLSPNEAGLSFPMGLLIMDHDSIWMADVNGCTCLHVLNVTDSRDAASSSKTLRRPFGLAGDTQHVYWTGEYLKATTKQGSHGVTEILSSNVREIVSYGHSAQPFPPLECLIPRKMDPDTPLLFNHSSHSLHLTLPRGVTVNCSTPAISLPTTVYEVYYGTVDQELISKCTPSSPSHCKVVRTVESSLHITDLHPYTTYTVFVTLSNYYSTREHFPALVCDPIMLRTAPGAPMPPKLLRLETLTPVAIRVVWRQPEKLNGEKVWYEVHWKSTGASTSQNSGRKWAETDSRSNFNHTEFYLDLVELLPGSNYTIWVSAYSEKGDAFSDSEKKFASTFPHPNNITLVHSTPHNLTLSWMPPNDTSILRHQIMYRDGWSSQWNFTQLINFTIPSRAYNFSVKDLKPKTLYGFRIRAWYIGDSLGDPFIWPQENQFNFETLADKPSSPSKPIARGIGKALYEVSWKEADENGARIELYSLEYRLEPSTPGDLIGLDNSSVEASTEGHSIKPSNENDSLRRTTRDAEKLISMDKPTAKQMTAHWIIAYTGRENRWKVEGLDINLYYTFRVRAKNVYGWGDYSVESAVVSLADLTMVAEPQNVGVIIGSVLLASALVVAFILLFMLFYRKRVNEKPTLQSHSLTSDRRGVELATLRELPGGSFVHENNTLYTGDLILDMELSGITKVAWSQIYVTRFLGSGAFGEVFEGIARSLQDEDESDTRVAIKTLRKGANQSEKLEFIQEAKLMAQFKHPHIIQLLGICVDTDPCSLLLELMGGGDLLSYLRSNRPNPGTNVQLNLVDLLQICTDVAKGCVYLEEMHFVHRDLAARNCLVSILSRDSSGFPSSRVVKIGDFGLARDIYRNDYYRKDGEGLLPVRWMAPESLIDGIFTTQTDVWAFGVLLWEIMTLGQQPYPARSNLEVLDYVRSGGRLDAPRHSPHVLGNLMLRCWEFSPDNRPSFKDCLAQLELILNDFQGDSNFGPLTPIHDFNFDPYSYSDGGSDIKSTQYVTQDYQHDDPDNVFLPGIPENETSNFESDSTPTGHPHIHKYLEVLSDSNSDRSPLPSYVDDGYEIPLPRKPPRNPIARAASSNPATAQIGLPSPSYWNCENSNLAHNLLAQRQHLAQYRNLLASSTSEDADVEESGPTSPAPLDCSISEHHYFPNVGSSQNNSRHLRGVPCQSLSQGRMRESVLAAAAATQQSPSVLFNNQSYVAHQRINYTLQTPPPLINSGGATNYACDLEQRQQQSHRSAVMGSAAPTCNS